MHLLRDVEVRQQIRLVCFGDGGLEQCLLTEDLEVLKDTRSLTVPFVLPVRAAGCEGSLHPVAECGTQSMTRLSCR